MLLIKIYVYIFIPTYRCLVYAIHFIKYINNKEYAGPFSFAFCLYSWADYIEKQSMILPNNNVYWLKKRSLHDVGSRQKPNRFFRPASVGISKPEN